MSGCTFLFAQNSPLRTTLIDEASGHAKYQIDTPIRITESVTRIRKFDSPTHALPHRNDPDPYGDITDKGNKSKSNENHEEKEVGKLPETSDEIARIYWEWFSSDRIVFRGRAYLRKEFLPKCGKMKGSHTFIGPDGIQYRWAMGAFGLSFPKLVTTDEKKTVIAEFHRAHYITKRQKARLEVQPAGMDMLDYIVLTFVFAEYKRREREQCYASY